MTYWPYCLQLPKLTPITPNLYKTTQRNPLRSSSPSSMQAIFFPKCVLTVPTTSLPPCVIMHLHKIHSKPELNHVKMWLTMQHHEARLHAAVEHLKRFKSYHQSTHNHHGQQCRVPHHGQPQNGHENATYPLRTTSPPPSMASAAAVGGLHRRRHSRGGYRLRKPPRPSPTMAAAVSFVSIACAFQTLDGFLVSGGAAHTPCGCAGTLYSPNYQNTPGFRLSCT